jgi:NADH-quinone oxidoreductase subunit N
MSGPDVVAMLPLVVLAAGALVTLTAVSVRRSPRLAAAGGGATLGLALASLPLAARVAPRVVRPLLVLDGVALVFLAVVLGAALAVLLLSVRYLDGRREPPEEFHLLLLLATLGAAVLVTSRHFASLFLGLELLGVGLYGLIAYPRSERRPVEAGLKYLILAGASSAFLLFGGALLYASTGSLALDASSLARAASGGPLVLAGLALLLAGLAFKLALVPFHMWTPDVYQGAPAPVAAFVATVSKGAVVAVLLRIALALPEAARPSLAAALALLAVASMLGGNLLALLQEDLKRLIAYSSIAHLGYVLVALGAAGPVATEAVVFYVPAYAVSTLVAFGVVGALSTPDREAGPLDEYRGLFWRRPWLAAALTASLLSLAGLPVTAGFVGKFALLAAGVGASRWVLVGTLVLGSVLGLYYYLRVVVAMVGTAEGETSRLARASLGTSLTLGVLVVLLVGLGLAPAPLQAAIRLAVAASP